MFVYLKKEGKGDLSLLELKRTCKEYKKALIIIYVIFKSSLFQRKIVVTGQVVGTEAPHYEFYLVAGIFIFALS